MRLAVVFVVGMVGCVEQSHPVVSALSPEPQVRPSEDVAIPSLAPIRKPDPEPVVLSKTGDALTDEALDYCRGLAPREQAPDGWRFNGETCGWNRFACPLKPGSGAATRALEYLCREAGGMDPR